MEVEEEGWKSPGRWGWGNRLWGLGKAVLRKTMWPEALENQGVGGRLGPLWNLSPECSQGALRPQLGPRSHRLPGRAEVRAWEKKKRGGSERQHVTKGGDQAMVGSWVA